MAERIRRSTVVPHPVPQLLSLLSSRAVVQARGDADGMGTRLVTHEVTQDASGPVIRIVTATDVALDWLPEAIRSRLGSEPRVERTETWTCTGEEAHTPLEFSFEGAPVSGSGSCRLSPEGTGSRLDAEIAIRVDVPLLGGLVERAVAPRLAAALDAEASYYASLPPTGSVAT